MIDAPRLKPPGRLAGSWFAGMLLLGAASAGGAQDSPQPPQVPTDRPPVRAISLQPQAPVGIPSDPPPHEGAMIDLPIILEPPDIIVVEVLEALPGRPITGERLIRHDGTISLGFYGSVHVRGLTIEQAKVKIILHLRRYLTDSTLGLIHYQSTGEEIAPAPMADPQPPPDAVSRPLDRRPTQPADAPATSNTPVPRTSLDLGRQRASGTALAVDLRSRSGRTPLVRVVHQQAKPDDVAAAFQQLPRDTLPPAVGQQAVAIDPHDSSHIFVDIAAHNTKIYYVQGDVGSPGRLPFTGKETVLDALNFAGGLIPTAEPTDIHLYRPTRGDQPTHDYPIDYAAILRGDAKANLQVFPNDRIMVARNAIVQKTIAVDRAAGLMQSIFSNYSQFNTAVRSVNPTLSNAAWIPLPDWFESIWTEFAANPALLNDPEKFHATVTRLLDRTRPKQ